MPAYDYLCRSCDTVFEVRRGLGDDPAPAPCPAGHEETSRLYTPVAVGGGSADPAGTGGGCCGGGCCG